MTSTVDETDVGNGGDGSGDVGSDGVGVGGGDDGSNGVNSCRDNGGSEDMMAVGVVAGSEVGGGGCTSSCVQGVKGFDIF